MPKFTSKPTTIEATQWFPRGDTRHVDIVGVEEEVESTKDFFGPTIYYVTTIHGQRTPIVSGDWIIPEPDGVHHYPCKPDIFEKRWAPLSSPSVPEVVSDARAENKTKQCPWCGVAIDPRNPSCDQCQIDFCGAIVNDEQAAKLHSIYLNRSDLDAGMVNDLLRDRAARVAEAAVKDELLKRADAIISLAAALIQPHGDEPQLIGNPIFRNSLMMNARNWCSSRPLDCPPANAGEGRA